MFMLVSDTDSCLVLACQVGHFQWRRETESCAGKEAIAGRHSSCGPLLLVPKTAVQQVRTSQGSKEVDFPEAHSAALTKILCVDDSIFCRVFMIQFMLPSIHDDCDG